MVDSSFRIAPNGASRNDGLAKAWSCRGSREPGVTGETLWLRLSVAVALLLQFGEADDPGRHDVSFGNDRNQLALGPLHGALGIVAGSESKLRHLLPGGL